MAVLKEASKGPFTFLLQVMGGDRHFKRRITEIQIRKTLYEVVSVAAEAGEVVEPLSLADSCKTSEVFKSQLVKVIVDLI